MTATAPRRLVTAAVALAIAVAGRAPRPLAAQGAPTAPAAPSNAERILNDRYTRSHDYDLVHQRVELQNFSWDSLSFDGRVATVAVARRDGMAELALDAGALLTIKSITDARGARLTSTRRADTLRIRLPKPARFGDTLRVTIEYHGRVENGHGLTFIKADGRPHRPQQIWSMGMTDGNHRWFPTYDDPDDKLTWELVVTVPAAYTVVSNGRLVSDRRNAGGTRTFDWLQEKPASVYLASIVVAPLARIRETWRGLPLEYYVYPEDSTLAAPLFRVTSDMIDVYSRLLAMPFPWTKYAQTTVADFFGGQENVTATTLVDWLPDARAYLDRPWYQRVLIPHELAHQWFGNLVTVRNWANTWLSEGFAQFMPGQYWEVKQGRQSADDYYLEDYRRYLDIDARRPMPLASMGSNNIYPKGSLVLRMLKLHLGEARFWAGMRLYLTRHAFGNVTTDDLRQAFLDATGENLAWFFDQWMYQAGYPAVQVTAAYDSTARGLTLTIAQTQTDSLTPDTSGVRYTIPTVFRGRVAVRVGTSAGDVVREVELRERTQTLRFDSLPGAPTMVVFDDGNRLLKTLQFDQPTAWLATQLARDPDLWNRTWVISQLAVRAREPAATAALARAAQSSDYFLTRAQAAEALANGPAETARPALEAAARDTSAQVRAAALGALAGVGGKATVPVFRTAWSRDSSYEVRAAALSGIAELDSAGARPVILEGLTTPSYRDVIQTAAITAIARSGDTSYVGPLVEHAGDQQLVVSALALFAVRGNASAQAALTALEQDRRPWVRRWAKDAAEMVRRRRAATR
jgi:aminopeptidase N